MQITARNSVSLSSWKSLYPWLVWLLGSGFLFYKYLLQVSPAVMVSELMGYFHLNGAQMGNLAAFYFYAYLVMQLPVGILLDKFNPRWLITVAILICAIGAALFSSTQQLSVAYLGRLFIGFAGAFSAVGTMKLVSVWFSARRFALLSGLMLTIGMLGAVCGEAPLVYMVVHFGWQQTIWISAVFGFFLAVVFFVVVRNKSEMQQSTDRISWSVFLKGLMATLTNKQSWLISIYSGLAFAPVSVFAGLWGVPYLIEKYSLNRGIAAILVSLIFVGFACGAPFAGWLSDRIARRKPIMIYGTGISFILSLVIFYITNLPLTLLVILLWAFGFFAAFFFVSFALIREINPSRFSGSSIGFINMFNAASGAIFQPLIGMLLDLSERQHHFSVHDYNWALLVLPIALLIAVFLQAFIKESYCEPID